MSTADRAYEGFMRGQTAAYICARCGNAGFPSDKGEYCTTCSNHFTHGHLDPIAWRSGISLNLGCSDRILDGFINVDIAPANGVMVADLREAWPWSESSAKKVLAHDIIEHLPDKIHTMNELWRVLEAGGVADIVVPTTDGPGAFQDPTHVSFWNRNSFKYYEKGNPYRERFAKAYGIRAAFKIQTEHIDRTVDGPKLRIVLAKV